MYLNVPMYLPCFHLGRGLHINVSELRADTLRYKKSATTRGTGRNAKRRRAREGTAAQQGFARISRT